MVIHTHRPYRLTWGLWGKREMSMEQEMMLSPVGRQGQASNRGSSAAREFLGMACAVVAVGSELD